LSVGLAPELGKDNQKVQQFGSPFNAPSLLPINAENLYTVEAFFATYSQTCNLFTKNDQFTDLALVSPPLRRSGAQKHAPAADSGA
jgi:hypothetical protein